MRETADIRFRLAQRGHAALTLFDAAGRRVRSIVSSELHSGVHSVRWDGRDDAGHRVHAGLYFYRLEAGGQTLRRTVVVVP
jgi:flagellar hook assembly protein FlgD